jgi:hypothetical protein
VHIEERLEFQTMRRKAGRVPESKAHGDGHYAVRRGRIAVKYGEYIAGLLHQLAKQGL